MAGESHSRGRATTLKTYTKRVKRSFPVPAGKNTSGGSFINQKASTEGVQRRVLSVRDENRVHKGLPDSPSKEQQDNKPALSTTLAASQRQALQEINPHHVNSSSSGPFFKQSLRQDPTSPRKTPPTIQRHTSENRKSKYVKNYPRDHSPENIRNQSPGTGGLGLSASHKDILQHENLTSSSQTTRITDANTPNSSHQATNEINNLESVIKPSKKRERSEGLDSALFMAKKVKRSSIKSYFTTLPNSSSPSTTFSNNFFSDKLDGPSSPPTSSLSGGESPNFQTSRKKTRRTLSLKPLLPSSVNLDRYKEGLSGTIPEITGKKHDRTYAASNCVDVPMTPSEDPNWMGVEGGRCGLVNDAWSARPANGSVVDGTWDARVAASTTTQASLSMDNLVSNGSNSSDCVATIGETDKGTARSPPVAINQKKKAPQAQITFHQLRFITDRNPTILCDDCGMMFNRTIESELRSHARFHKDNTRGKHQMKGVLGQPLWEENNIDGFVHRIYVSRRGASAKERKWYENALEESMNRGLDGLATTDLWRNIKDPSALDEGPAKLPKYKVYVYTKGIQVVSLILAKRIARGGSYYVGPRTHNKYGELQFPGETKLQEYVNLDYPVPVVLSVDRLWTDPQYQRKGYATRLLDHVRKDFIPGLTLHKCQIAFSLPTTAGCAFATKYCAGAFRTTPFVIDVDDPRIVVQGGRLRDKCGFPDPLGSASNKEDWLLEIQG